MQWWCCGLWLVASRSDTALQPALRLPPDPCGPLQAATAAANALRAAAACSPAVAAAAAERLDSSALAAAAVRDADAAAAAITAAAAAAADMDVSAAAGELLAAKWPLVDAATACAAELLPSPASSSSVAAAAAGTAAADADAAVAVAGGLRLRREVLCVVLSQSVAALSEYPEGQVLPLLRCLRRCWGAVAAAGPELQVRAARHGPQARTGATGEFNPARCVVEIVLYTVVTTNSQLGTTMLLKITAPAGGGGARHGL